MKRTNLVLDERLLDEARQALGAKTYSDAVNKALEDFVRRHKMQSIAQLFGKVKWEGDLAEMRQDMPRRRAPAKRTRAKS